ncbi:hypothetical protein GGTG_14122 [Gaeumannomyces tritici R3-111a-1]|uniref:Uncharacterized protein n=1 Tax=Gaeumannomyces tritici (strain R3-111a-1) TaxID=644352 RepID=J3PKQ7_GAET3|nr:hypothetical protein GGTG_14122 [Gaeumannomyces tritici R3-111a-1]EJT68301.1 hypothetical protein GGTG_14122 [Gaeumannomyces tritici R3-111a-1]
MKVVTKTDSGPVAGCGVLYLPRRLADLGIPWVVPRCASACAEAINNGHSAEDLANINFSSFAGMA